MQRFVHDRGMTLATKGDKDKDNPNRLNDEMMVVLAFFYAVLLGKEVSIVTRDKDVIEQLYKLQYLIDTHHVCHCIAKRISEYPDRYKTENIKNIFADEPNAQKFFNARIVLEDAKAIDIEPTWYNEDGSETEIFPSTVTGVPIHVIHLAKSSHHNIQSASHINTMTANEGYVYSKTLFGQGRAKA